MFRVAANMNETYYGEDVQQRKTNLVSDLFDQEKATLRVVAAPSSPPTKDQKEAKGHEEAKEPVAAAYQQPCPMVP